MKKTSLLLKKLAGFSAMALVVLTFSQQSRAQIICTDNYEPNDSKHNATQILTNEAYHSMIKSTLDVDWFKFDITTDQPNIRVTLFDLPKNYNLFLYNSSSLKLGASKHNNQNSELIVVNNLTPGTYYVKVRGKAGVFDPNNCYSLESEASSTPFRLTSDATDFVNVESQFELFPNPASNYLFVQCDEEQISSVTFSVFNLTGQKVSETKKTINENTSSSIDVSSLQAGEYFLEIRYDGGVEVKKFVVSK